MHLALLNLVRFIWVHCLSLNNILFLGCVDHTIQFAVIHKFAEHGLDPTVVDDEDMK